MKPSPNNPETFSPSGLLDLEKKDTKLALSDIVAQHTADPQNSTTAVKEHFTRHVEAVELSLAWKLRKPRIDAGTLTLASPEVKFVLDSESLDPTDVQAYTLYEANAVVEEFMLFANVAVSKKILRHFPTLSVTRLQIEAYLMA